MILLHSESSGRHLNLKLYVKTCYNDWRQTLAKYMNMETRVTISHLGYERELLFIFCTDKTAFWRIGSLYRSHWSNKVYRLPLFIVWCLCTTQTCISLWDGGSVALWLGNLQRKLYSSMGILTAYTQWWIATIKENPSLNSISSPINSHKLEGFTLTGLWQRCIL